MFVCKQRFHLVVDDLQHASLAADEVHSAVRLDVGQRLEEALEFLGFCFQGLVVLPFNSNLAHEEAQRSRSIHPSAASGPSPWSGSPILQPHHPKSSALS